MSTLVCEENRAVFAHISLFGKVMITHFIWRAFPCYYEPNDGYTTLSLSLVSKVTFLGDSIPRHHRFLSRSTPFQYLQTCQQQLPKFQIH
jgi:hypothetical protein